MARAVAEEAGCAGRGEHPAVAASGGGVVGWWRLGPVRAASYLAPVFLVRNNGQKRGDSCSSVSCLVSKTLKRLELFCGHVRELLPMHTIDRAVQPSEDLEAGVRD